MRAGGPFVRETRFAILRQGQVLAATAYLGVHYKCETAPILRGIVRTIALTKGAR